MASFAGLLGRITAALRVSGQAILVFMMLSICYDATMRYLFAAPTRWSLEVNTFLMVYLALVPAADVLRSRDQLHISFFRDRFGPIMKRVSRMVIAAAGAVFCAIMTWRGFVMAANAYEYGERMSTTLGTPMVIPFSLLPIGFGLLTLQFLCDGLSAALGHDERVEEGTQEII